MTIRPNIRVETGRKRRAFTLVEVLIASAIAALMMASLIYGYLMSATRAEWSGYSLAAQSLAQQRLEQTRACKWDPDAVPLVDELISSQFPVRREILDIPISGTNIVYATNFTTITLVNNDPPLKCIQVDCVWDFRGRRVFTNTVITYRSPDN
jgi:prepilin-type N-terminal cleavage/methylation domain-containing protein